MPFLQVNMLGNKEQPFDMVLSVLRCVALAGTAAVLLACSTREVIILHLCDGLLLLSLMVTSAHPQVLPSDGSVCAQPPCNTNISISSICPHFLVFYA